MSSKFTVLKRNRSTNTTYQQEPAQKKKFSKLKSNISLLLKSKNNENETNKNKFMELIQCLYRSEKRKNDIEERNSFTLPNLNKSKKIKSILIKRSDTTNPSSSNYYQHSNKLHLDDLSLTKINSKSTHLSLSDATINSEDLTSKEFADIAGIRILPEYDEEIYETSRKQSSYFINNDQLEDDSLINIENYIHTFPNYNYENNYLSLISSNSSYNKPNIWDTEFWSNPYQPQNSIKSSLNQPIIIEEPISIDLTTNSQKENNNLIVTNDEYIIKKGRFEIHMSKDNLIKKNPLLQNNESFSNQHSIEWKRKKKI